jgi:hypothetical protein
MYNTQAPSHEKKRKEKKAVFNDSISTTMNFYVTIFHAGNNMVKKKGFIHAHAFSFSTIY